MNCWIFFIGVVLILTDYAAPQKSTDPGLQNQKGNTRDTSGFVFNGTRVKVGQFPETVAIRYSTGGVHCTGVIIDRRWILTAAICLRDQSLSNEGKEVEAIRSMDDMDVIAGEVVYASRDQARSKHKIVRTVLHPSYEIPEMKQAYGVRLVEVRPDFVLDGTFIKKAYIAKNLTTLGERCKIAGWGRTNISSPSSRYLHWMEAEVESIRPYELYVYSDPRKMTAHCYGDAGGGYMCHGYVASISAYFKLIGPNCDGNLTTAAPGLIKLREWIEKVIGEKLPPKPDPKPDPKPPVQESRGSTTMRVDTFF